MNQSRDISEFVQSKINVNHFILLLDSTIILLQLFTAYSRNPANHSDAFHVHVESIRKDKSRTSQIKETDMLAKEKQKIKTGFKCHVVKVLRQENSSIERGLIIKSFSVNCNVSAKYICQWAGWVLF